MPLKNQMMRASIILLINGLAFILVGCPDEQPAINPCLIYDLPSGKCLSSDLVDKEHLIFKSTEDLPLEEGMQCLPPGQFEANLIYMRDQKAACEQKIKDLQKVIDEM